MSFTNWVLVGLFGALAFLTFVVPWGLDWWQLRRETEPSGPGLYVLAHALGLELLEGETDQQLRARCVERLKSAPGRPS